MAITSPAMAAPPLSRCAPSLVELGEAAELVEELPWVLSNFVVEADPDHDELSVDEVLFSWKIPGRTVGIVSEMELVV